MQVAALCDGSPTTVAPTPLLRRRALGVKRAAADVSGVAGDGLLELIRERRWDFFEALAEEDHEMHRSARGIRRSASKTSPLLEYARSYSPFSEDQIAAGTEYVTPALARMSPRCSRIRFFSHGVNVLKRDPNSAPVSTPSRGRSARCAARCVFDKWLFFARLVLVLTSNVVIGHWRVVRKIVNGPIPSVSATTRPQSQP